MYCSSICHIKLVLKRCISGLPQNECPFIPKKTLLLARSRYSRSVVVHNSTDYPHDLVKRSPFRFPDDLIPQSQKKAVDEPPCEERRHLVTEILLEKGKYADSMLSRFVGNFIMIFSNHTSSQEVSERGGLIIHMKSFCVCLFVEWKIKVVVGFFLYGICHMVNCFKSTYLLRYN